MKFKLKIVSDNEAMQTMADVARALRVIATRIDLVGASNPSALESGGVRDDNGNTVGSWTFKAADRPPSDVDEDTGVVAPLASYEREQTPLPCTHPEDRRSVKTPFTNFVKCMVCGRVVR